MPSLADALAAAPVVLHGGLGTLLEARGNDLSSSLWSARLLLDRPEEIRAALEAEGLDAPAVDLLLMRSVQLARRARTDTGHDDDAWVAASVGPYGATL